MEGIFHSFAPKETLKLFSIRITSLLLVVSVHYDFQL